MTTRRATTHGRRATQSFVALALGVLVATFLVTPPGAGAGRPDRGCNGRKCNTTTTTADTTTTTTPTTTTVASTGTSASFIDDFDRGDGLVTNEYATWNPGDAKSVRSPDWQMTSGSLFVRDGAGWTGGIDDRAPDASSSTTTNSAVFRLTTARADFDDVAVRFRLRTISLTSTNSTPAAAWDGVHVFLRYQSEESLYYASVNRRDGGVVIKKKVPGGPSNGGTYHTLATGKRAIPFDRWQDVRATVRTNGDGSVTIAVAIDGKSVIVADDTGVGGPPIRDPGRSGIRGDNTQFEFDDFRVVDL